ncbi:hypothetical protein [Streptomyces sp. NPDC017556]|uniref:hypothetical protein n=1 Tax=Streptomyces sp. NPDC017556 TaxID=3365002 RepID=UPI0037B53563
MRTSPCARAGLAGLGPCAAHLPRRQRTDGLALLGLGASYGLTPREVAAGCGRDPVRLREDGPLPHSGGDRLVPPTDSLRPAVRIAY